MSDALQFLALFLLPVGVVMLLSVLFGLIGAIGAGVIILAVELWFIGREINLSKQRAEVEKENRANLTGWSAEEREILGGTNG